MRKNEDVVMETKKLSNGVELPVMGYGVYTIEDEKECIDCVQSAIGCGFRQIDTAAIYKNETAVGKAIQGCGIPRENIFITTKLWVQDAGYEQSKKAIDESLRRLQMDYVDMLMIHEPMGDVYGQWKAMEEAYRVGKVRALGVSNMYADRLMDFIMHMEIRPMVNQVRTNPYFQHVDTHEFMEKYQIVHQAHSPFSQGEMGILQDKILNKIAEKYHKSTGQVILRLTQRNIAVLTRTMKISRMKENLDIFDFELDIEDMKTIGTLDRPDGNSFDNRNPENVKTICSWKYR